MDVHDEPEFALQFGIEADVLLFGPLPHVVVPLDEAVREADAAATEQDEKHAAHVGHVQVLGAIITARALQCK